MLAQRQGALAVVASLWAVADESTARLMQQFYRNRLADQRFTKAEALQQAQLALLTGKVKAAESKTAKPRSSVLAGEAGKGAPAFKPVPNAPYAHPYYWAPLILIGNWR
jgi:CHAT domain-containing protein